MPDFFCRTMYWITLEATAKCRFSCFGYDFGIRRCRSDSLARLHQINIKYEPEQDRLLLRISTDDDAEMIAWLTRRFTKLLLGVLNKMSVRDKSAGESTAVSDAMDEMKKDAALAGADFSTQYKATASSHPFGKEPVLLTGISFSKLKSNLISLSLKMVDKRSVTFTLSRDLLVVLIKLLRDGSDKAEWDLGTVDTDSLGKGSLPIQSQAIH